MFWLNVHIGRMVPARTNLLKHSPEGPLELSSSSCEFWETARIEDGSVVIERKAELIPVKIIEGPDEPGECQADVCLGSRLLSMRG